MTQNSFLLNLFEKICRSNIYLFLISRYLIGKFFSKIIYDKDFNIIKLLKNKTFFNNKKNLILDIGANDGMSYRIMRKLLTNVNIISFEPNIDNFRNLKKIEKTDRKFNCKKIALSDKTKKNNFYTPYFKNYAIRQIAGISKSGVENRLKKSLFIKNLLKKINLKKENFVTRKLDDFNYKPCFIKIDIEGHEFECVKGALKTIKKCKPILMVEYDLKICNKIFKLLKRYNYQRFIYNKFEEKIEKFNNQKIFNIFFINEKYLEIINNDNY